MAVYKVPQDVEADDKFLGPLSFKQFIFMGISLVAAYATFITLTSGLWFFSVFTIIPFIATAALAVPWSKDQPTELWLASRIRFFIKPRRRIWDQSGVKELVQITAPKREAIHYTDGLSQNEVRTRFNALATMIDSRGWAVKNLATAPQDTSDRLVDPIAPVQTKVVIADEEDAMDESTSPIAKQFDGMIQQSEQKHKSETLRLIAQARSKTGTPADSSAPQNQTPVAPPRADKTTASSAQNDFWFMQQPQSPSDPSLATFQSTAVVHPGEQNSTPPVVATSDAPLDEAALLQHAHQQHLRDVMQTGVRHEKVLSPQGEGSDEPATPSVSQPQQVVLPVTKTPDPAILDLAKSNDLNIDTLARQAKKKDDDEVVISLH